MAGPETAIAGETFREGPLVALPDQVVIARRFNGPPDSAHGGYACAMVARYIEGPAEVSLRSPPPLERPLAVERATAGEVRLLDGEQLVAEGRPAGLEIDVPRPPSAERAQAAGERSPLHHHHTFPDCFVCGPARAPGDGLRVICGPLDGERLVADSWTPEAELAGPDGNVVPEFVWSVLDCPSGNALLVVDDPPDVLLGRLTASIVGPVEAGRRHVAIGWLIERDGRKLHTGSALFTERGELRALARALWIELRAP
jgi:hypothetical protein